MTDRSITPNMLCRCAYKEPGIPAENRQNVMVGTVECLPSRFLIYRGLFLYARIIGATENVVDTDVVKIRQTDQRFGRGSAFAVFELGE